MEDFEMIKPTDTVLQELLDLLIDNKVHKDIIDKFYELSKVYHDEKKVIKKMHRDIISFMR